MSDLFKKIEKKTGVKMDDVSKIANSFSKSDLKDEKSIRKLVRQVSKLSGKKVPKQKEDMIVNMLLKNNSKIDSSTISKMLGKK
ncbi:stage VI sporulation protein F [Aquibacillus sp. 3ASR75-11]|uniref:Stage VI sporulation protein F n=1 Tax=Terrihalobacillus insolitus TaxID=2950438 RepID=A0A9X3WQ23_9BACI|nr:stage VI sporulation protein F [Terrihalobacillus insolitus]MDC3412711.1 stage VI sporulation protein F [Terrihalobacillus insolitus]MDC3423812.1 stage VI sporulation protein F [Terrihalobacillus insolitus]